MVLYTVAKLNETWKVARQAAVSISLALSVDGAGFSSAQVSLQPRKEFLSAQERNSFLSNIIPLSCKVKLQSMSIILP